MPSPRAFGFEQAEFLVAGSDWLDGGKAPVASGREAIASLELTLAMIRSAETGEVVRL